MIWIITKKELLLNLLTFKFAVGTIVCVVLTAVFMPVLASDYQQKLKTYNDNIARNEAELRKVKVYKNITPTVYSPPTVLSVFSEGVEKRLSNSAKIELEALPEISASLAEDNPYVSIFPILDISLIFKIVISILSLLITYNAISGEREWGTLKLMLSGMVPRYQVLIGKLLAAMVTLTIPVTTSFIVGVLILLFFPMIDLTIVDWGRIGLMYIASLVFILAMLNIGLLFSCLVRKSAISLVLGLFFWILCVVVIPNGSVYLARQVRPLEHDEKRDGQCMLLREKRKNELREVKNKLPRSGVQNDIIGAFGNSYVLACDKRTIENKPKHYSLQEPLKNKYAYKLWEIEHSYFKSLLKQRYIANTLSRISPISVYENVMVTLASTDVASSQHFIDTARAYRSEIVEYIRSKTNNFSSPSYFTQCDGDWDEYKRKLESDKQYKQYKQAMQVQNRVDYWRTWHAMREWLAGKAAEEIPSLRLQDLPQFVYRPDVVKSVSRAIPDLALLIFVSILFFAFSFVTFVKYDVR